jgi:hypothetical protein
MDVRSLFQIPVAPSPRNEPASLDISENHRSVETEFRPFDTFEIKSSLSDVPFISSFVSYFGKQSVALHERLVKRGVAAKESEEKFATDQGLSSADQKELAARGAENKATSIGWIGIGGQLRALSVGRRNFGLAAARFRGMQKSSWAG